MSAGGGPVSAFSVRGSELLGIGLTVAATGTVIAAVWRMQDLSALTTLVISMLMGCVFVLSDYGFTAGFHRLLVERDGRTLAASLIIPAIAACVIIPVTAEDPAFSRFVAPIGVSLVAGAALFGAGMQVANGCGSGTLIGAGRGSRRMWVTLPFFCLGGVLGSLLLPSALRLPSLGSVDLPELLGPWVGLLATQCLLAILAIAILRGSMPSRKTVLRSCIVGVLAACLFIASGEPWSVTMAMTLWGAKALRGISIDVSGSEFWSWDWARDLLHGPLLGMAATVSNAGLLLGALMTSLLAKRRAAKTGLGPREAFGAALGGLLMGVGARLSFGCNVGAFVGGLSSGSLHGFIWFLAALPGCAAGIWARPFFGLSGWLELQIPSSIRSPQAAPLTLRERSATLRTKSSGPEKSKLL